MEMIMKKGTLEERIARGGNDLTHTHLVQSPTTLQSLAISPLTAQLAAYSAIANRTHTPAHSANGGLPQNLQAGIESLSGIAMHDVRVHYNSSKPAQLQAYAYAQGTDIHLAPGQEKHLAHEAWHVVQQKQDRVKPTLQLKGVAINDDSALEREADVMGAKAMGGASLGASDQTTATPLGIHHGYVQRSSVLQRRIYLREGGHITYPLPPSVSSALKLLRGNTTARENVLMQTLAGELEDDVNRVVDREALANWVRVNALLDVGDRVAAPFEAAVDPAEFPAGVEGYLRDKAGYLLIKSGDINVQDGDDHHQIQRGWLAEALRAKNLARKKRDAIKKDTTNRISAGLTIIYEDDEGIVQAWQGIIPGQWSSGEMAAHLQPALAQGHEDHEADHHDAEDEAVALAALPVAAVGQVEHHSQYDLFLHEQRHLGRFQRRNSLSGFVESASEDPENVSAEALYHSENSFAFQMHRDASPLRGLLQKFLGEAAPTIVRSVTLDVDSHPNTMCGNMCRGSIDSVRQLLDRLAREAFAGRLAGRYMTHASVYAEVAFAMSKHKQNSFLQHKKKLGESSIDLEAVNPAGHPISSGYNFEVFWEKVSPFKGAVEVHNFLSGGINYNIVDPRIAGDGNCFFGAIARALGGAETAATLRERLAHDMHDLAIEHDGIWAEDEHITAMAAMIDRYILVHVIGADGTELTVQGYGNPAAAQVHIANINFNHFENVVVGPAVAAAVGGEMDVADPEEEAEEELSGSESGAIRAKRKAEDDSGRKRRRTGPRK
jgi:Domain of unknown function (DUF4157)